MLHLCSLCVLGFFGGGSPAAMAAASLSLYFSRRHNLVQPTVSNFTEDSIMYNVMYRTHSYLLTQPLPLAFPL